MPAAFGSKGRPFKTIGSSLEHQQSAHAGISLGYTTTHAASHAARPHILQFIRQSQMGPSINLVNHWSAVVLSHKGTWVHARISPGSSPVPHWAPAISPALNWPLFFNHRCASLNQMGPHLNPSKVTLWASANASPHKGKQPGGPMRDPCQKVHLSHTGPLPFYRQFTKLGQTGPCVNPAANNITGQCY